MQHHGRISFLVLSGHIRPPFVLMRSIQQDQFQRSLPLVSQADVGVMPPRNRRTPSSRALPPPPPPPPPPSSHSTTSGSSSLSPIKSAQSLSSSENQGAETQGDVSSSALNLEPDADELEANEDEDESGEEDEDGEDDGDEGESGPSGVVVYRYPASVPDFTELSDREKTFKIARFVSCTVEGCDCSGLEPPKGSEVVLVAREEVGMHGDVEMDGEERERTEEGWWRVCERCRHGWEEGVGHVFPVNLGKPERVRRGKVVGRIEEILQVGKG